MKCAILTACAGLALAGSVWMGAGSVLGAAPGSEGAAAAAVVPVAAVEAAREAGPGNNPARACVQALSKDACDSVLERGELSTDGCPGTNCRTAYVRDAQLVLRLIHNQQACTTGPSLGLCDEVERKDGRLIAGIQYTLRLNNPCKLRGFFDGRWEHFADDGSLYQGTVTGTIGVGTKRAYQCQTGPGRVCERCLEVEFLPEQGLWRIGVEASFVGTRVTPGIIREDMRFTLSGDFYAPGDLSGPYDLAGGWRFEGAADGAHAVYCP